MLTLKEMNVAHTHTHTQHPHTTTTTTIKSCKNEKESHKATQVEQANESNRCTEKAFSSIMLLTLNMGKHTHEPGKPGSTRKKRKIR